MSESVIDEEIADVRLVYNDIIKHATARLNRIVVYVRETEAKGETVDPMYTRGIKHYETIIATLQKKREAEIARVKRVHEGRRRRQVSI